MRERDDLIIALLLMVVGAIPVLAAIAAGEDPGGGDRREQSSITGPKMRPIRWVPCRWTRNSPTRIATVIGTTSLVSEVVTTVSPSIAPSTEIAVHYRSYSSICMPSSTTRFGGRSKNAVGGRELRDRNENRVFRQRAIFDLPPVSRVWRPM